MIRSRMGVAQRVGQTGIGRALSHAATLTAMCELAVGLAGCAGDGLQD